MFIRLTRRFKIFTAEAKERLNKYQEGLQERDEQISDNGLTLEWFKEQNITPPKWLEYEDKGILIDLDKDIVESTSDYLCNIHMVEDIEAVEHGTMITYNTGKEVLVEEQIETILKMIKK